MPYRAQQRTPGRNPHEIQHHASHTRADVDIGADLAELVGEDGPHCRGDDGGDGGHESGEEGENGDGDGGEAGVDGEGGEEDGEEGGEGGGEEADEHGAGGEADDVEVFGYGGGDGDCGG